MKQNRTKAVVLNELQQANQRIAELESAARREHQKLVQSQAQYHALAAALDLSLCRWLPDTSLTFANEKYYEIFGIQGEAVGQKWLNYLPEEGRASTTAFYLELADNPRTVTYEHPVTIRDGSIREYQWIDTPILDETGSLLEFQSIGMDVTERKNAEKSLGENETRLRGFLDATPDAMFIINPTGRIIFANVKAEAMFGFSHSELQGLPVESLLPGELRRRHMANRLRYLGDPRDITAGIDREIHARRKDGREFPAEISLSHHTMAGGAAVVLCAIRDVTERIRSETLIAAQRDLAKLAKTQAADEEFWAACFQSAMRVSGLDCGGIYLYDQDQCGLNLVHHTGLGTEFIDQVEWFAEKSPSTQMVLSGKNIYFSAADLQGNDYHQREGIRSLAAIPIQHQGQVLGCLNIASHADPEVPDSTRSVLETIAAEIGNLVVYRQTEASLQTSRQQLSQALIAARMGSWRWHLPTNRLSWSPEAARIFGVDFEQNDFQSVLTRFHPDDRERVLKGLQEALLQGNLLHFEYRIYDAAGDMRWITNYGHIEYDAEGKPLAILGLVQDITERKQAEQALKESELKFHTLFKNLPMQGVIYQFIRDEQGEIVDWEISDINPLGAASIGGSAGDLIGKRAFEMFGPEVMGPYLELSRQVAATGEPRLFETHFDTNGRDYLSSVFLVGSDHYANIAIDITERKQAEKALRASEEKYRLLSEELEERVQQRTAELQVSRDRLSLANIALEKAARMKDEFLASMSHELRTPLTGILGLSESLQLNTYGGLNEKQNKALRLIEESGHHLLDLINDILDLSKIEAGKLELDIQPLSLSEICQSALELTRGMANKKRQKVSFTMIPPTVTVQGDARRIKQMLVNLLSNAIKFTAEDGALGLDVRVDEDDQVVSLSVWDNGIGIAAENIERLFQPFVQLDSSLARQYSGTGLGLSLVQRMADLHGGSVQVESSLGAGSRFTILLPWSPTTTNPVEELPGDARALRKALVVEDLELDAQQLVRYLHLLGLEASVLTIGQGVVEGAARDKPGVILLDLLLPDTPGLEVLAGLKNDPRTRAIPVVICSVVENRSRAMKLGAAGYLVKPISYSLLRDELERVSATVEPAGRSPQPGEAGPLVFIVDDNELLIDALSSFLETRGFRTRAVSGGTQLLDIAPELHPDIILMDIQMPGMDGIEATHRIRGHQDPLLADVPIIAVTALAMVGDRERCLAAGANEYLSKPVKLESLVSTIQRHLR
jgi:PAS domain S-box-containing protein